MPTEKPMRARLFTILLVALAGVGGFYVSRWLDRDRAPVPVPATEVSATPAPAPEVDTAAVEASLRESAERVADRILGEGLDSSLRTEDSWRLVTPLARKRVEKWLDQALTRVGGSALPVPGEETPYKVMLEVPPNTRTALCLALEDLGALSAGPDFTDSGKGPGEAVLAGREEPLLPPDLGASRSKAFTVVLEVAAP